MERTLNDINYLITKLKTRVDGALQNNQISAIEVDMMLDLLKQTYLMVEGLKMVSSRAQGQPFEQVHIPISILETEPSISGPLDKVPFERVPQSNSQKPDQQPEPEKPIHPVVQPEPVSIAQPEPVVKAQPVIPHEPETVLTDTPLVASSTKQSPHTADLFGAPSIADKLKSDVPSLNDKMTSGKGDQSLAHRMQLKPITDLKAAIGINEKFQFVNELFDGHTENYNDALTRLNNCDSGSQALWLLDELKSKHNWDEQDDTFNNLKVLINRRYL